MSDRDRCILDISFRRKRLYSLRAYILQITLSIIPIQYQVRLYTYPSFTTLNKKKKK
eukprot:TRINITY_DN313_c0_g1_i5.p2 TRINITY_DN313_c0_g1~~TRINITY_DN313_c0_g1_i5.p2  ORF type:complete len:57 (-),score=4.10 TRINITY_DN313_c0_g1_i5:33-203(-)